jgi:hypothetical protein
MSIMGNCVEKLGGLLRFAWAVGSGINLVGRRRQNETLPPSKSTVRTSRFQSHVLKALIRPSIFPCRSPRELPICQSKSFFIMFQVPNIFI